MKKETEWDVIIIGSGIAGLSAAIEAKSPTNKVCVVEKLPMPGGNSLISDGGIGVPNSDLQKHFNINDSVELLKEDMLNAGQHINDVGLVELVAKHANEAYMWTKQLGVQYQNRVDFFGGHSVPRCLTPINKKGKDLIDVLSKHAKSIGVEFYLKTEMIDIKIVSNKVASITVQSVVNQLKVLETMTIKQGLIIATGGFGSDKKLIESYDTSIAKLQTTNLPSANGFVIKLLQSQGAKLIDMQEIQCGPWGSPDEKGFGIGPLFADYIALPYGVLINPTNAQRFVNERADRKVISDAMMKIEPYALAIADQRMVENTGWDLNRLIKKQIVFKCDSLNEIAEKFNIDFEIFNQTIKMYNQTIKRKEKDVFDKALEKVLSLEKPPYFVMKTVPKIHHTMGGLKINKSAQVIKEDGTCFHNILAAGECTGGVHGRSRLGSMALVDGIVMGRIAGQHMFNVVLS